MKLQRMLDNSVWLRFTFLMLVLMVIAGVFYFVDPISQDLTYHNFADKRSWLSVPNFGDVMSNVPFLIVGIAGPLVLFLRKTVRIERKLFPAYIIFFVGIFLTGIGSGYYHLNPNNETLVWDRLPMTIGFMAFFAIIVAEYVHVKVGQYSLWPLLLLGVISVGYWHMTEMDGRGDLRPYALVQFLPMLLIPIILLLFTPSFNRTAHIWWVIVAYGASKMFEVIDAQVFLLSGMVSGHTIKHIIAAMAPLIFLHGICCRNSTINVRNKDDE